MRYCKECGTQLSDEATFCKECGTRVEKLNVYGLGSDGYQNGYSDEYYHTENNSNDIAAKAKDIWNKVKTKGTKLLQAGKIIAEDLLARAKEDKKVAIRLGAGAVAVGGIFIGLIVLITMDKRVNVEDFIVTEVSGYNTVGTVSYNLDYQALNEKIAGKKSGRFNYQDMQKTSAIVSEIDLYVDNATDLSNGDEVEIRIGYNNEIAHQYGVKLVGETYTVEVSGLRDLEKYDPFEQLVLTFSGVAPNAKVNYTVNDTRLRTYNFQFDKKSGLSNGDEITVTYTGNKLDLEDYGYIISETSKTYTCEGISGYVTASKDLTGTDFDKMKTEAKDCIDTYLASIYEQVACDNLAYFGNYVLANKSAGAKNIVYVVYKGTVASKVDNAFETKTVYFPVGFENVVVDKDGKITYSLINSNIYGSTGLKYNGSAEVKGYVDGQKMFNELIQAAKVNYTCDVSKELQQFGTAAE